MRPTRPGRSPAASRTTSPKSWVIAAGMRSSTATIWCSSFTTKPMSSVRETKQDLHELMFGLGRAAREAAAVLAGASAAAKSQVLRDAARDIRGAAKTLLRANAEDVA